MGKINIISEIDKITIGMLKVLIWAMSFKFYQAKSFLNNISVFLVNQLRNISIVNVNFTGEKYDLIVRNN